MRKGLLSPLLPDGTAGSIRDVDFEKEYERGVRGVIFDIDNTLVPHGQPADEMVLAFFEKLKECGLKFCLISNNSEERVKPFADAAGAFYVFKAGKPLKKGYIRAMEEMGTRPEESLFVGDQLFTDVFGAKRAGIRCILVNPIDPFTDPPFVVFKRKMEGFLKKRKAWRDKVKNLKNAAGRHEKRG
ncbi:MAG: YqeG family HAD IIIA-type phosphatase [Lachnospiraceae bacterium]|nr:YqeG family HAD IIIA-type phosphatase [Lachnospiraceae bacterium]